MKKILFFIAVVFIFSVQVNHAEGMLRLQDIRDIYRQYDHMTDYELSTAFHRVHHSDMSYEDFAKEFGGPLYERDKFTETINDEQVTFYLHRNEKLSLTIPYLKEYTLQEVNLPNIGFCVQFVNDGNVILRSQSITTSVQDYALVTMMFDSYHQNQISIHEIKEEFLAQVPKSISNVDIEVIKFFNEDAFLYTYTYKLQHLNKTAYSFVTHLEAYSGLKNYSIQIFTPLFPTENAAKNYAKLNQEFTYTILENFGPTLVIIK